LYKFEENMKLLTLILLSSIVSAQAASIRPKVLYGKDDRKEVDNYPNELIRNLAKSVAGRVSQYDIYPSLDNGHESEISRIRSEMVELYRELGIDFGDDVLDSLPNLSKNGDVSFYDYDTLNLQERINACSTERFLKQPTLMSCTGFLVGKDILATAGHCMVNNFDCSGNNWIFNFKKGVKKIPANNVYKCKKIIAQEQVSIPILGTTDYALIQLDREVTDATPLKFRTEGRIKKGTSVAVIGHPLGLPLKIADNAKVRAVFGKTFKANLDTYGGNSGSPVVDINTGLVEGILVHGAEDLRQRGNCTVSRTEDGKKEGIYKITRLKMLQEYYKSGNL
jgi:hypothetical protein